MEGSEGTQDVGGEEDMMEQGEDASEVPRDGSLGGKVPQARAESVPADWKNGGHGTPPLLRLLLQFDQVLTQRVLSHQINWLQAETEQWKEGEGEGATPGSHQDPALARTRHLWIYALLANLSEPLHRDTYAEIRRLYIACVRLGQALHGAEFPSKGAHLASLGVSLLITGKFYHQAPGS